MCPSRCHRQDELARWEGIERIGSCGRLVLIADLAQVLTSGRRDQAIDSVVGVVIARLDALVAEKDRLLSVIEDVSDVADRIVSYKRSWSASPPRKVCKWVRRKVTGSYS